VRGSGRRRAAALAVAALVALPGCGDDGDPDAAATPTADRLAADCRAAVDSLLVTTQRYLDSIEGSTPATPGDGTPAEPPADPAEEERRFTAALSDVRAHAAGLGCDPAGFRDDLAAGMRGLRAGGPIANAVLLQLQADAGATPQQPTVPPGGDVAAAVAAAEPDAVVQLEAGEYELAETLVLLRGVTIRGAGRDATTVRGAADGVVLVLTGEPVVLDALTLARSGDEPGGVVSAAPAATLTLSSARIRGARSDDEGNGGIGVLMAAGAAGQTGPGRRVSLRITDSEALDNAVAGIVLSGEHRAEITGMTVQTSGQCGICFLSTSDGTVANSRLSANAAGLVIGGDARPVVRATTVDGGDVGVQVIGRGAPELDGVTVRGSARAAFLFAEEARGSVRASTCEGVEFGIVVGPAAAPDVGDNPGCQLARGQ
jgi:hypothetical protein